MTHKHDAESCDECREAHALHTRQAASSEQLRTLAERREAARAELTAVNSALATAAREAHAAGVSEVAIARAGGVARMTVRKWLGK